MVNNDAGRTEWWVISKSTLDDLTSSTIWDELGARLTLEVGSDRIWVTVRFANTLLEFRDGELLGVSKRGLCAYLVRLSKDHPEQTQITMINLAAPYMLEMMRYV